MKNSTRTLGNDTDAPAMEQLADAAHRTVDRVAEGARALEQDVRFRAAELGSQFREQEKRARTAVDRGARKGRQYLRKEPLRGAGIVAGVALAAGAILGAVLLRR